MILALWLACGGGGDDTVAPPAEGTFVPVQALFDTHCAACHSGPEPGGGLVLVDGQAWAMLVGVASVGAPLPRVLPGDPDGSYLWRKLRAEQALVGGGGTPMPPTYLLTAAELAPVEAWIRAGAPQD